MKKNDPLINCYSGSGICLYEYPEINGIKQYIQVRGSDRNNPLLLFLHGGPGGSVAGLCHIMQPEWEKHFTVVNWDQRNACKTFVANKSKAALIAESGSISDYVTDIDAVISYLHTVYNFSKIILVGFSWGTVIGASYARMRPEKVACYVGISQVVNYREGLKYSCNCIKSLAKDNAQDSAQIDKILAVLPEIREMNQRLTNQLKTFNKLGIKYISKDGKQFPVKEFRKTPFLSFKEKWAMTASTYKRYTGSFQTLMTYDLRNDLHFEVPVMFIGGDEDFTSPNQLIQDCFNDIKAPDKQNILMPRATHACFFDQPEVFLRELLDFTAKNPVS